MWIDGRCEYCGAEEHGEAGRELNAGRECQGFKSQADLDAFYARIDHAAGCIVCSSVSGAVQVDDGLQPVMGQCAEGVRLYSAWIAVRAQEEE